MKKTITFALIIFFLFSNTGFAHTGLESSDPAEGSVLEEQISDMTLTFETPIEDASRFELQYQNGAIIPIDEMKVDRDRMTGTITEPLENGNYAINWNIIGEDGHPMSGTISFTMEAPSAEEDIDPAPAEEETVPAEEAEEKEPEEVPGSASEADSNGSEGFSIILIILVGALAIALAGIILLRRKK